MSCYEWERGTFVIPSNQWAGFKKALRDTYNKALAADLVLIEKALVKVKADNKGKRGVNWLTALQGELTAVNTVGAGYGWGARTQARYEFQLLETYRIVDKVVVTTVDESTGMREMKSRLTSVKKTDFPEANGKTCQFDADLGTITFDDAKRTVHWDVSENNHACDSSRESLMGRTLFALLRKMPWGRNSGGYVVGNDEYHRDANRDEPGGGGNRLKDTFGPLGDRAFEDQTGLSRRRSSRSGVRTAKR